MPYFLADLGPEDDVAPGAWIKVEGWPISIEATDQEDARQHVDKLLAQDSSFKQESRGKWKRLMHHCHPFVRIKIDPIPHCVTERVARLAKAARGVRPTTLALRGARHYGDS